MTRSSMAKNSSEVWMKTARVKGSGPPFVVVGRLVGYRRDAVREWIRSREVQTTVSKRSEYNKKNDRQEAP
jgi:hypothetical protein